MRRVVDLLQSQENVHCRHLLPNVLIPWNPSNLCFPSRGVTNLSTEAIIVHNNMGLLVNNFHLCLGICTPEYSAYNRVGSESTVEKSQPNVLGSRCARGCPRMGCQAVVCGRRNRRNLQQQAQKLAYPFSIQVPPAHLS